MPEPEKKSSFSSDDICRIIEACTKAGVSYFENGQLRFQLVPTSMGTENSQARAGVYPTVSEVQPIGVSTETPNHEKQAEDSLEEEEVLAKEERIAMMILEDPVEFERQLGAGELEEMIDDDGSDGTSEET